MVCSMCLSIFNQEPRPISTQQTAYHQTLTSLQHSVDAKCPICTYLWELISKARPNTNTTSASAFGDLVGQTPYQSSADGNLQNIEYHFSQTPDAYHTPQVRFQMCSGEHIADLYLLNHLAPRHGEFSQQLSASTGSSDTLEVAQNWLQTCLTSHKICSGLDSSGLARTQSSNIRPSRLIQIVTRERCCLLESSSFPNTLQYLTLSHCWGMEKSFSLVSSNLDIMKDKIPMERLSLVFQHALLATLTFGYNFIWIDSLCIIQDSIEDWNTESAHMGSIYKNSVCTLAATGFPDGSYGLFAGRDPALVLPFQVNVDLRHWKRTTDHDIAELRGIFPDSWNKEIENSPLYQRAWVVQERVLSPRILHFTKSQIYWECCESRCSEVYPQGVFKKHVFGSMSGGQHVDFNCKTYSLLTGHPKYEHLEERHREAFHLGFMNAIIKAHSWSKLTFPSDKLVSLAGIANELQSVFDDTYIAGMFYKHLPHSLLWTVHYPTIRRSEYGAPTWSWASVDGPINPWRGVKFDDVQLGSRPPTLVYLTGIETHPTTKNPCGPLNAARLSIQGELFQLTASGQALLASIEPPQLSSPPNFVKIDDNISISVTPDMKEFYTMAKEDTYCAHLYLLPLIGGKYIPGHFPSMEGLILLPSGKSKGEFQRVGYMSVLLERQRPVHISECSTSNSSASWWDGAFTRVIDPSIYVEHESPDSHTIVLM